MEHETASANFEQLMLMVSTSQEAIIL